MVASRRHHTTAEELRPGRRLVGLLGCATVALAALAAPPRAQEPDEREIRSFAIPETSEARALMEQARQHLAARRWSDAIGVLQTLLEDHRGEVLGGRTAPGDERWRSQQPVHVGAAAEAARLLAGLPEEARALYLLRFGPESRTALEQARAAADRAALIEVARRYPLTEAARRAWWSIGDLELELGQLEAARAAWQRAARAAQQAGEELGPGALARLGFAFPAELEDGPLAQPDDGQAVPLAPPGPGSQSWRVRLDGGTSARPFNPAYYGERYNLLPVLAGDLVLVCDSLRLTAVDAWTGHVRWETPEPPGWREVDLGQVRGSEQGVLRRSEFFDAIDRDGVLIAPAAGGRVAVAALQVPVTQLDNTSYQRIRITTIIPDRRLFAFDLETGRELWNHMPPPGWDGESGRFAQRMRVAGPPVVAGSRVLVPTYRLQGRVDYHVACYDLLGGELLWSTSVISGQLPLNMFGRHAEEFAAAPLVVQGETVLALTQLGALAALDLFSGDILWETLYERLPLPQNERQWDAPRRRQYWTNSAPVISGDVVVATPLDSTDLVGIDLASGAMLWSIAQSSLVGRGRERWTLLGADADSVFLAGSSILACRAPGGLSGTRAPSEVQSSPPLADEWLPRPAFGARWIVAPTPARRAVFDRLNLRFESRQLSAAWEPEQEYGNALLAEGALFTLTGKYLTCIFDWGVQERRFEAALAADPSDDALAFAYSGMLLDRARRAATEADYGAALGQLARAREELGPRTSDDERGVRARAQATLHRLLRMEAEVLTRQADSTAALERLERARELAPTLEMLRDTLLESARLHASRGETRERMRDLDELEQRCSALALPWSTSVLEAPSEEERAPERELRVGQWVAVERARELRRGGDAAGEMALLHDTLSDWGDVQLGLEPGVPHVSERIAELLAEHGRGLYAPFEQRARALLESALAAEDAAALDRVVALYPHSAAAREANEQRLDLAWRAGDTRALALLVQQRLPPRWIAATATDEELAAAAKLASALGRDGNRALESAWVRALAEVRPELQPLRPDEATLAERAAELARHAAAAPARRAASFGHDLVGSAPLFGSLRLIGRVPRAAGEGGGAETLLFAGSPSRRAETLRAFEATAGELQPLWERAVERTSSGQRASQLHALLPSAVVVPGAGGLIAIDPQQGLVQWTHELDSESVVHLTGSAGVVVVTLSDLERGERVLALDAVGGVPLWSLPLEPGLHTAAVVGREQVVLLPRQSEQAQAQVHDLFTGRLTHEVPLEEDVGDADLRGAWIEGSILVLPSFPRPGAPPSTEGNSIVGIDLAGGRRAWRVAREPARELDSIVRCGADTYLILFPHPFSGGSGALVQLDTRLGAVRPLGGVRLTLDDAPLGVRRSSVTLLDEPWLFLLGPVPGGQESVVRAVQLPYGERWAHRLPVPPEELYNTPPPLPAQSESTLVLAFTQIDRSRGPRADPRTTLLLLDRNSGLPRDARELPEELGRADSLRLIASGRSLFVEGRDALLILTER